MSDAKIIRKMSVKTLGVNPKEIVNALENDGDEVHIFTLAGIVRKVDTITTNYGDSVKFTGEFAAKVFDGSSFNSNAAFLPGIMEDMFSAAYNGAVSGDNPKPELEFACHVGVAKSKSSAVGYEYTCTPVRKISQSDRMAALMSEATSSKPKALPPAPAKTASKK